ncbi:MAG: hypothetical protein KDC38_13650 [Planctomycetes bacterium]|nr:hypothetical protein [Planctomycetota bacterium]
MFSRPSICLGLDRRSSDVGCATMDRSRAIVASVAESWRCYRVAIGPQLLDPSQSASSAYPVLPPSRSMLLEIGRSDLDRHRQRLERERRRRGGGRLAAMSLQSDRDHFRGFFIDRGAEDAPELVWPGVPFELALAGIARLLPRSRVVTIMWSDGDASRIVFTRGGRLDVAATLDHRRIGANRASGAMIATRRRRPPQRGARVELHPRSGAVEGPTSLRAVTIDELISIGGAFAVRELPRSEFLAREPHRREVARTAARALGVGLAVVGMSTAIHRAWSIDRGIRRETRALEDDRRRWERRLWERQWSMLSREAGER